MILPAVEDSGRRSTVRTSSSTPASNIATCAVVDPACQLRRRNVEPDDQRRVPGLVRPESVAAQGVPGFGELERAHDASAVVRVHGGGRGWVAPCEFGVGGNRAAARRTAPPSARAHPAPGPAACRARRALRAGRGRCRRPRSAFARSASARRSRRARAPGTRRRRPRGRAPRLRRAPPGDWLVRIGRPR